jgi:hypothetical protein
VRIRQAGNNVQYKSRRIYASSRISSRTYWILIRKKNYDWRLHRERERTHFWLHSTRENNIENSTIVPACIYFYKCNVFGHYPSSCLYLKTVLFISQNTTFRRLDSCLRPQVKPTQLGPTDRASPYLSLWIMSKNMIHVAMYHRPKILDLICIISQRVETAKIGHAVLRDLSPCSFVYRHKIYERLCCLHLQTEECLKMEATDSSDISLSLYQATRRQIREYRILIS